MIHRVKLNNEQVLLLEEGRVVKAGDFWTAVTKAEEEAAEIWNQTHGCEKCGPENELGYRSINPRCKACKGEGVIL